MICIAYSAESAREHALADGRLVIQLPPPPLSLIFVLHVCAQTRTFIHTLFLRFTPSQDAYDPPPAPYSPCTEISRRGTEYLRDTETDSLQLYWPPRLLHLPLPYPGCRTASQAALPTLPACLPACSLPRLPTSQQRGSRNRIPKIFPTFP